MSKIGILSFPGHNNHGANLTAYALQNTLEGMGHEARNVILHCNPHLYKMRDFADFAETYIKVDDREAYGEAGMWDFNADYDTFIVGSDQVWRRGWKWKDCYDGCFWLRFAAPGKRRIAMAASFGNVAFGQAPEKDKKAFAEEIRKYSAISVREEFGCSFIPEVSGREATLVADPVFMLSSTDWEKLMPPAPERTRAVVAHTAFEWSETFKEEIAPAYAGYDVVELTQVPTVEWLRTIHDAEFVITNSFHISCFCLIFGTPFAILTGIPKVAEERLYRLVDEFGLAKERVVNVQGGREATIAALQRAKEAPYDAEAMRAIARKTGDHTRQWLEQALVAPPVQWEGDSKAPGGFAKLREKWGSKRWRVVTVHKAKRGILRFLARYSPLCRPLFSRLADNQERFLHIIAW